MKSLKIILSGLLIACLLDMPYGYFQFVRFSAAMAFIYFAYKENKNDAGGMVAIYVIMAVLFQPFYKIALGRELWNVVDVLVAIFLIGTLFIKQKNS